ncbi:MAG TPA: hypothetical protein VK968_07695 [Roseimicrobium sp.]|nr:hypothetical protein [Roseimicrobium sp.]
MVQIVFSQRLSAALERGDRALREYQELLERGTDQDVWMDEVMRGAAVRWNILKSRALHPAIEPTQAMLWANAERLEAARRSENFPSADGGRRAGPTTSTHGSA